MAVRSERQDNVTENPEEPDSMLVRRAIQAAIEAATASGMEDIARELASILMDLDTGRGGPVH